MTQHSLLFIICQRWQKPNLATNSINIIDPCLDKMKKNRNFSILFFRNAKILMQSKTGPALNQRSQTIGKWIDLYLIMRC